MEIVSLDPRVRGWTPPLNTHQRTFSGWFYHEGVAVTEVK